MRSNQNKPSKRDRTLTPPLFHLNYLALLQQKTPFVWALHTWLNRLLSSKTNTFIWLNSCRGNYWRGKVFKGGNYSRYLKLHITPPLFHLNYSAFLQQKTPFVWARHAWLNRLLSSKTNTFSTKTPRMNGRLLCVPCKKRDPVWMGRG